PRTWSWAAGGSGRPPRPGSRADRTPPRRHPGATPTAPGRDLLVSSGSSSAEQTAPALPAARIGRTPSVELHPLLVQVHRPPARIPGPLVDGRTRLGGRV